MPLEGEYEPSAQQWVRDQVARYEETGGREANTLCAKANDISLSRIGLDLKAVVEQFREQVQNIE